MTEPITWVGLDAHKKFIQVAVLQGEQIQPTEWRVDEPTKRVVERLARKIRKMAPGEVRCCYEAGPGGFALKRQMEAAEPSLVVEVIAPSLIPFKPGDRIKTDRRDALKLAQMHRAGALSVVAAPTEAEEAARALVRLRDQVRTDVTRARQRLSAFLLARGLAYRPENGRGANWTQKHYRWLDGQKFDDPIERLVFDEHRQMLDQGERRLKGLDEALEMLAETELFERPVKWLRSLRGVDTLTAMIVATELFDVRRFGSAPELMSYLGLVPSERSSGGKRQAGGITKTGNRFVRRALVEAAWHYARKSRPHSAVHRRREGLPPEVVRIAERAEQRLHSRYWKLTFARRKEPPKAATAVARELVGFIWAILQKAAPDEQVRRGVRQDSRP